MLDPGRLHIAEETTYRATIGNASFFIESWDGNSQQVFRIPQSIYYHWLGLVRRFEVLNRDEIISGAIDQQLGLDPRREGERQWLR